MQFLHVLSAIHPLLGVAEPIISRAKMPVARSPSASAPVAALPAPVRASERSSKASIEAITRQPEMRDEITAIQWLGFALTEACFFYGLVGGFIAFFL